MRAPYFYPTSIQKESHGHARPGDSEWESIHVHEAVREAGSGIDEAVSLSFEKARQVPAEMREEISARGGPAGASGEVRGHRGSVLQGAGEQHGVTTCAGGCVQAKRACLPTRGRPIQCPDQIHGGNEEARGCRFEAH